MSPNEREEGPVIGISCRADGWEESDPLRRYSAHQRLVQMLTQRGAAVMLIPPSQPASALRRLFRSLDGLLLSGGTDICPAMYKRTPKEGTVYDLERDELELELVHLALAQDIPTLGICRGMHLLNVALGGTLYMDLAECRFETIEHSLDWRRSPNARHPLTISKGSLLSVLLGGVCHIAVNSSHRQAVCDLGEGLRAVGRSPDGLVEAFEHEGSRFVIGVQWHPEWLEDDLVNRRLVDRLVEAATSRSQNSAAAAVQIRKGE